MPTNAFFNLSQDKKNKIINASIDEFSNNLFVDASINQIIKTIDMPRGSFYLYFENKEDLYFYIINIYVEKFISNLKTVLIKCKGDLFDTFIDLFDTMIGMAKNHKMKKFIHNIFMNMNTQNMNYIFDKAARETKYNEVIALVDKSKLNIERESDLFCMLNVFMTLLIHSLSHTFHNHCKSSLIRDIYIRQLHIIKKGFYA